jgi:hypothetical protein
VLLHGKNKNNPEIEANSSLEWKTTQYKVTRESVQEKEDIM